MLSQQNTDTRKKYKVYEVFSINGKYRINNAAKIAYTIARHNNPAYVETTLFLYFNFQHVIGNLAKIAMNRRHWCPHVVERRPWHPSTYERKQWHMLASERGGWRPYRLLANGEAVAAAAHHRQCTTPIPHAARSRQHLPSCAKWRRVGAPSWLRSGFLWQCLVVRGGRRVRCHVPMTVSPLTFDGRTLLRTHRL